MALGLPAPGLNQPLISLAQVDTDDGPPQLIERLDSMYFCVPARVDP